MRSCDVTVPYDFTLYDFVSRHSSGTVQHVRMIDTGSNAEPQKSG